MIAASLLSSCGTQTPTPVGTVTEPGIRGLFGPTWLPNGNLVAATLGDDYRYRLVDVDLATGHASPRPIPDVGCLIDTVAPRAIPHDRVAFLVSLVGSCKPSVEIWSAASDGSDMRSELAIPVLTGQYLQLPGSNSWLYDFNTGFCAWIASAPDPFEETLGITVARDDGAISLDAASRSRDCDGTMRAALPALRADGTLAFLASPASSSLTGGSRVDAEWLLYSAQKGNAAKEIRGGITDPIALAWDPIGKRLGLTARINGIKGLWLIDEAGKTELLASGRLTSAEWSPDGQRMLSVREGDDPLTDRHLVVIDLPR
ncbi:MAG TPA: hypothetical protein VGQ02_11545 [Candidatus Limnocylindrales bacterium]|jgi:hypothetical protein|nr:hypothetical protein [Candidatus Limnocylindrales bacterium]